MSGGEVLGDAIGVAMAAEGLNQLAPPADGHTHAHARTGGCGNCGTPLAGAFCHHCGQAGHVHRTLMAFAHDLLHGVFHFEGRVWRTIPMLMARPGVMTRDYIAGRRVRYVSPIALFLFSIFLLFAVVKHLPVRDTLSGEGSTITVNGKKVKGLAANEVELVREKAERARLAATHQPTTKLDGEIAAREEVVNQLKAVKGEVSNEVDHALKSADKNRHYSNIPAINEAITRARANPELALYKLESNAYKYAWGLIPLSVPMVWLLFPFSRRWGLYDHTVFVTYSLCAMSLMVVGLSLWRFTHLPGIAWVVALYPPWHMYRQLKDAYALTRAGALWRTSALLTFALLVVPAFAMVLLALGMAD